MVLGITLYFDSTGHPVETVAYRTLGYGAAEAVHTPRSS
jgi:hypothetical protein